MKLVGERRALSAVVFALFFFLYLLSALLGDPATQKMLFALTAVYGLAFFSLVAGYFWARWYAMGVGLFGCFLGVIGLWQAGPDPQVLFIGGTHLAATLMLCGTAMSESYDGKPAWRAKLHLDDNAAKRLGTAIVRAGASLPVVLVYAFAPKSSALAFGALALGGLGFHALIRMRTWGVLALAASGGAMLTLAATSGGVLPAVGGALMVFAAAPFAAPMLRFVRV